MAYEEIMVSPHFTLARLTRCEVTPVRVFEDQVQTCVLDFAKKYLEQQHSDIAVLMLCCSVFEPIGRMLPPARISELTRQKYANAFCWGCWQVLGPEIATQVVSEGLYTLLRCGLYHDGWIRHELVLGKWKDPVRNVSGKLRIDPEKFYHETNAGVTRYIKELNQTGEVREAFYAYYGKTKSVEQIAITAIPNEAGITVCPR